MPQQKPKKRPRFHYMTPDRVIDYAYTYHTRRWGREISGTPVMLAEKVMAWFEGIKAAPGSKDEEYLMAVTAIVLSVGNGIFNRKLACEKEKEAAGKEEREMYNLQNLSRTQSALVKILMRVGIVSAATTLGYQLAHALIPFIPEHIARETGTFGPSLAISLVFLVVSSWVSLWWTSRGQRIIDKRYHLRIGRADLDYERGKLDEQEVQRADLVFLWENYTGEKYRVLAGFDRVMRDDLLAKEQWLRRLRTLPSITIAHRFFRRKWWRFNKHKNLPQAVLSGSS